MSSSARTDLLIYIAVALTTTIGLFVVHTWYVTYLDQRYHAELATLPASEALLAAHEEPTGGKLPIAQAMGQIAKTGRPASVTPAPSNDLSAVSGWIHARGFKPATAHPVRVPAAPKPAAAVEPAPEAPAAAPAPVEAPKTAKPGPRQLQLKTDVVRPQVAH